MSGTGWNPSSTSSSSSGTASSSNSGMPLPSPSPADTPGQMARRIAGVEMAPDVPWLNDVQVGFQWKRTPNPSIKGPLQCQKCQRSLMNEDPLLWVQCIAIKKKEQLEFLWKVLPVAKSNTSLWVVLCTHCAPTYQQQLPGTIALPAEPKRKRLRRRLD